MHSLNDFCFQTNATVIDTVTDCDTLVGSLSSVKWSQPVVAMATDVMNACVEHLRMNFTDVLETGKFKSMSMVGHGLCFIPRWEVLLFAYCCTRETSICVTVHGY